MKTHVVEITVKKRMQFHCTSNDSQYNERQIKRCLIAYGTEPVIFDDVESCNMVDGEEIISIGEIRVK